MLETGRLVLRGYRKEDFERVHAYGSLPDFAQFEPWGPNTVEDTQRYISDMLREQESKDRFKFNFAVAEKANDLVVGGCGIRRESQLSVVANLGWAIAPEFQGKGYATEAAAELIRFGFKKLALRVIYATCDARNSASCRVMEKLGMKRVGLLIADKMQKGQMRDTLRYEILP